MHFSFVFPRFKLLSGAEKLILKLADALIRNDHRVSIICHQFDPSCVPLLNPQIHMFLSGERLDFFRNRYLNAVFDYVKAPQLARIVPEDSNAVCCFGPALAALPELRTRTRSPLLYFCYEPPRFLYTDKDTILQRLGPARFFASPVFHLYRNLDRKRVLMANATLSNSEFGRKQIEEVYGRDATVITHGLDPFVPLEDREAFRKMLGIQPDEVAVITVNYLHPRKRIDLFIRSIQEARKSNPKVKGIIVGDGPEKEHLRRTVDPTFLFTGFIPEQRINSYYQACDLYLHTARLETFGLSVIEAAGYGLPVVSVDEGGPYETVMDGITGYLAPPEALTDRILKLAADQELRKNMGTAGMQSVREKYSWSKGAQDFESAVERS